MNNITIKGRLTRKPELKVTDNGKEVANFTVAVNRRSDRETADFFDCSAWGKTAAFVETHFKKGQEIVLSGAMQSRKWEDKEGNKRTNWSIFVDTVEFCGKKEDCNKTDDSQSEQQKDQYMSPDDIKGLPF